MLMNGKSDRDAYDEPKSTQVDDTDERSDTIDVLWID